MSGDRGKRRAALKSSRARHRRPPARFAPPSFACGTRPRAGLLRPRPSVPRAAASRPARGGRRVCCGPGLHVLHRATLQYVRSLQVGPPKRLLRRTRPRSCCILSGSRNTPAVPPNSVLGGLGLSSASGPPALPRFWVTLSQAPRGAVALRRESGARRAFASHPPAPPRSLLAALRSRRFPRPSPSAGAAALFRERRGEATSSPVAPSTSRKPRSAARRSRQVLRHPTDLTAPPIGTLCSV